MTTAVTSNSANEEIAARADVCLLSAADQRLNRKLNNTRARLNVQLLRTESEESFPSDRLTTPVLTFSIYVHLVSV